MRPRGRRTDHAFRDSNRRAVDAQQTCGPCKVTLSCHMQRLGEKCFFPGRFNQSYFAAKL